MAFVAVYDLCVLFPRTVRDILARIAAAGLVRARWSEHIHQELQEKLVAKYSDIAESQQIAKLIKFLTNAVPGLSRPWLRRTDRLLQAR
jgi:hypothetical protein